MNFYDELSQSSDQLFLWVQVLVWSVPMHGMWHIGGMMPIAIAIALDSCSVKLKPPI